MMRTMALVGMMPLHFFRPLGVILFRAAIGASHLPGQIELLYEHLLPCPPSMALVANRHRMHPLQTPFTFSFLEQFFHFRDRIPTVERIIRFRFIT